MGDWSATRAENRYGCFLPDLTGLATGPSAASLPGLSISAAGEKKASAKVRTIHHRTPDVLQSDDGFENGKTGKSAIFIDVQDKNRHRDMSRPKKISPGAQGAAMPSKRESILEAAQDIFMEMGYGAANMDAVAARANVSKATIYAHFDNKRELFEQVLRDRCRCVYAGADIVGAAGEARDAREILRRLATGMLRIILSPDALAINRVALAEAPHRPDVGETFYAIGPTRAHERLTRLLGELTLRGLLAVPEDEAPLVAELFLNMLKGDAHMRELLGVAPCRSDHGRLIEVAVELIMARYGPTGK